MNNYCINEGLQRIKLLNPSFEFEKWVNTTAIPPESIPDYHFYEKQNPTIKRSCKINPKQIVGTSHPDYCNKSWIEVLGNLKRWKLYVDEIHLATENVLNEKLVDKKSVAKYGDNIIVSMGNHRCCFSKFLELDEINVDMEEYQFNHTLHSMVKEYENRGFYIDTNSYRNENWIVVVNGQKIFIPEQLRYDFLEFYDATYLNFQFIVKHELKQLFGLMNDRQEYFSLKGTNDLIKIKSHIIAHKSNLSNLYKPMRRS